MYHVIVLVVASWRTSVGSVLIIVDNQRQIFVPIFEKLRQCRGKIKKYRDFFTNRHSTITLDARASTASPLTQFTTDPLLWL